MKHRSSYICRIIWTGVFLFLFTFVYADQADVLDHTIKLSKLRTTRYLLLEKITDLTGYLFIYDSDTFNDNLPVTVQKGNYSLRQAIYLATGNTQLQLRVIGNHILIQHPIPEKLQIPSSSPLPVKEDWFTIEGHIKDKYNEESIPFATIQITGTSIGTITNLEGDFRIRVPDSLHSNSLRFTHIGYEPLEIENEILKNGKQILSLEPRVISLQEVAVRMVKPVPLIEEMLAKREENYALQPVHLTAFYREGVEKKKTLISLTEGVFKIHKTPFNTPSANHAKLLKMRHYKNNSERDTVITKIKSGIQGSLLLDVVKTLPDFLETDKPNNPYIYTYSDLTVIDDRLAYVIDFEPHAYYQYPFFKGSIYIDYLNSALLMVRFEVNPRFVEQATSDYISRKSKSIRIKAKQIYYTVSYKEWDGKYYINHVRGDLHFQVRKRKQLFNSQLHTWFEMVTCNIETENIQRFGRQERMPQSTIFSNTQYVYDATFWENFNVIIPEEELSEALSKINAKIEETVL